MEDLIILGAGTMAQEVTELVEEQGQYQVVAYAVNTGWKNNTTLNDLPILHVSELSGRSRKTRVVRGIWHRCPELIRDVKAMGFPFGTVIHPSASIARSATIYPGVVVNRLVAIGSQAVIGSHSLINRGCTIGHHTKLGEEVTLGPGVNIAGNCEVGNGVMIGMGANIIQNQAIEANQKIRASTLLY
jgi:sugar O-acyltransferase (sialic acid O-acetyltransferase NeuD family)